LASGKLALVPWQHAPSRSWRRVPDGLGHRFTGGYIHWRNLAERDFGHAMEEIIGAIPTTAVWVSIDKDVLPESYGVTNWDQGQMPLDALLQALRSIVAQKRVVGADICGEYAPPHYSNALKRWEAMMDQPRRDALTTAMLQRNEHVNAQLLSAL